MKRILKLIPERKQPVCSLEQVRNFISRIDERDITKLLDALQARFSELHPDSELISISVPKYDFEERRKTAQFVFSMFDMQGQENKEGDSRNSNTLL